MWLSFLLAQPLVSSFDVSATNCSLHTPELSRLTALELSSAGAPSLRVDYRCDGKAVTIGLENVRTGIRIQRRADDACCDDVEAERTLALLATGLFQAAGGALGERPSALPAAAPPAVAPVLPLPAPAPAPPPPILLPPPPAAPPRNETIAPEPADSIHVVGVSGRVRAWNLGDPIMGYGVGIDYRGWAWPTIGLGGYASALFGTTDRLGGEVMVRTLNIGASAAWRFARWQPLHLSLELTGGLSVVTLGGHAATDDFIAATVTGATGEVGLSFVPTLLVNSTQLELPLGVGALFRAPRGTITTTATATEVRVDGVSAGGALRVALGFVPRRSAQQIGGAP
jgi:hypothetical protein